MKDYYDCEVCENLFESKDIICVNRGNVFRTGLSPTFFCRKCWQKSKEKLCVKKGIGE